MENIKSNTLQIPTNFNDNHLKVLLQVYILTKGTSNGMASYRMIEQATNMHPGTLEKNLADLISMSLISSQMKNNIRFHQINGNNEVATKIIKNYS